MNIMENFDKVTSFIRAKIYAAFITHGFRKIGKNFKLYGHNYIDTEQCSVGDNCWFHAVHKYKHFNYHPRIEIGRNCMFGNNVHISCAQKIKIGENSLFGSNIYIGDHSHGSSKPGKTDTSIPPYLRELSDIEPISIGNRVWVGDGVVILAGTHIGDGCIIGANSVLKGTFPNDTLIAGAPARAIRRLT